MSIKHLDKLFKPSSVAVVGASNKANRPGNVVMKNLLQGDFAGPIMPVTFKYTAVNGVLAYKTIADLPIVPDLAIVCTRAQRVPEILTALGDKGCQNVIVIASGLDVTPAETSDTQAFETLQDRILTIAKPYGMRILGPNSIGLMVPGLGLNASYAHVDALLRYYYYTRASCAWPHEMSVVLRCFLSDQLYALSWRFLKRTPVKYTPGPWPHGAHDTLGTSAPCAACPLCRPSRLTPLSSPPRKGRWGRRPRWRPPAAAAAAASPPVGK